MSARAFPPPPDSELLPLSELLEIAVVTADSLSRASAQWQNSHPEPEFKEILEARQEEGVQEGGESG